MKISQSELEQLATLARLELPAEGSAELSQKLSTIIDFFGQLSATDTTNVEPMAHPLNMVQRLRDDTVTEHDEHEKYQQLASATKDGLYLVPKVIE